MTTHTFDAQIAAVEAAVARLAADVAEDSKTPPGTTILLANVLQLLAALRVILSLRSGVQGKDDTSAAIG